MRYKSHADDRFNPVYHPSLYTGRTVAVPRNAREEYGHEWRNARIQKQNDRLPFLVEATNSVQKAAILSLVLRTWNKVYQHSSRAELTKWRKEQCDFRYMIHQRRIWHTYKAVSSVFVDKF